MVVVKVTKLFLPCMFGATAPAGVVFTAFDKHGNAITSHELHGQIGTPAQPDLRTIRIARRAYDVRCDIPAGVVCEWKVFTL